MSSIDDLMASIRSARSASSMSQRLGNGRHRRRRNERKAASALGGRTRSFKRPLSVTTVADASHSPGDGEDRPVPAVGPVSASGGPSRRSRSARRRPVRSPARPPDRPPRHRRSRSSCPFIMSARGNDERTPVIPDTSHSPLVVLRSVPFVVPCPLLSVGAPDRRPRPRLRSGSGSPSTTTHS
jgi:hypothetical protein